MELPALDRRSVVPLYYQIQRRILEQIRAGTLKAGEPLPSEQEISERLGVSRMTARQALKSLCNLGVAYSQRGRGTFVSRMKLEKNFRQVLSFSEEMEARRSRPGSKVIAFEAVSAPTEVSAALHLKAKEKVIRLKRVRMADSRPMGVECTCLPLALCPDLLQKFDAHTARCIELSRIAMASRLFWRTRWQKLASLPARTLVCWESPKGVRYFFLRARRISRVASRRNTSNPLIGAIATKLPTD